ncbi:MAG: hypothetical protein ACTHQM_26465 [Thermoanaerobaculia bacterium]
MNNLNAATPELRTFEVTGTLVLGYKAQTDKKAPREIDIRSAGDSVTSEELQTAGMSEPDIESLLANATLADPDAPTRPSLAPIYAAHSLAARLAKHFGLLRVKGAEHTFEGRTYNGAQAFRDGVAVDRLETAIRAAWDELTD